MMIVASQSIHTAATTRSWGVLVVCICVRPTQALLVVARLVTISTCHKTRTPSFKTCRTHNNIVKEINGGTVRYVVNGTYRVCTDPQRRRAVSENYGWNWTRTSPYYKKIPIYLEERPSRSRYGYTEDEYTHSRRRAYRSYHYW